MASITVQSEGAEEKFPLEAATVTLGRGLESDVRLKDIKASRRHCQITKTSGGFQVVDLSSGNGTYVNGVQVKQQALHPGDKIQIGSTTITFSDASAPRPPAEAPAKTALPESTRTATRAVAASPAAGTKKVTVAAAAKTASQETPRPPAPTGQKPAPTRRLSAIRSGASTRSAPKVSADAPRPEARTKRRSGPVFLIMAGIGVVFIAVVAAILFTASGDSAEQLRAAVKKLGDEAGVAERAGRLDEAEKKYREVLDRIEGKDKFKGEAVRVRASIQELGERRALRVQSARRFAEIKSKSANAKDEAAAALAHEARQLLLDAGGAEFAVELREIADRLEKASGGARRLEFQARRTEIREKYGLATAAPRYGDAISNWQAWAGEKNASEEDRQKAAGEIRTVNQAAKEELERLRARASSLEKDNKKAEAAEELKRQRERFSKTACAEELESVIGQLEK